MRKCIVCGRPIRKRTVVYFFKDPVEARPAGPTGFSVIDGERRPYGHEQAREAKPDGHREQERGTGHWHIYTSQRPRTKAEAQRFVNFPIISIRKSIDETISHVGAWDGESYDDPFFDTGDCAKKQGYESARRGDRFTWKS